jgi:hypothetical protein
MVLKARAIYDCTADDDQELSFKEKAIIVNSKYIIMIFSTSSFIIIYLKSIIVVESSDKGWFEGTLEGTKIRGLFPDNYVEFFEEEEV